MSKKRIVECPDGDFTCPYYENGDCCMSRIDGGDPYEECDAFFGIEDEDEEYSWDERHTPSQYELNP